MIRIIILTIMVLLLLPTGLADRNIRVLNEINNEDFLNIRGDNIDLNESYLGYNFTIDRETIIFYFDMDEYIIENNKNKKIRKTMETTIETYKINKCLIEQNTNYCKNKFILSEENINGTRPIIFQKNQEIKNIRNNIGLYQDELRINRNPIINFLNRLINNL